MTKLHWFTFFLGRAVRQRGARVVIAALAVMLTVGVLVGLSGLSLGIREKLGEALKAYGANIIVTTGEHGDLPLALATRVKGLSTVESAIPQLYGQVRIGDARIEAVGVRFAEIQDRSWRIDGSWPDGPGRALVGTSLRDALKVATGDVLRLETDESFMEVRITGFFEKGGEEDRSVFLDLADAARLLGRPGRISTILVRSRGGIDAAVAEIRTLDADLRVKTLRQVARAEETLLQKIQLLMALVSLVVLGASIISVGSTMGATVLERREEIGLMKAIGGTRRSVGLFYTVEAAIIGCMGGLAGIPAGILAAELVSRGAFGSYVPVPWFLGPIAPVFGIALAVLSGYFPVRDAMKPQASEILRGE